MILGHHSFGLRLKIMTNSILFIAPWYQYRPMLPLSLILQTYQNWKLYLIHDGPINISKTNELYWHDSRIQTVIHTEKNNERGNKWGHPLRAKAIESISDIECDWIIHTNADNYYVPGFCKIMVENSMNSDIIYCDMIHNHHKWSLMKTKMEVAQVDCGAVMVRSDWAKEIGWPSRRFSADWIYLYSVLSKYPNARKAYVEFPLFIHN